MIDLACVRGEVSSLTFILRKNIYGKTVMDDGHQMRKIARNKISKSSNGL